MGEIDKRDRLKESPFSYKITKANKVMIYWDNRMIKTLSEKESKKFLSNIEGKDEFGIQLILAKLTGNFKRGNERK
ncbi:hypothetical protein [Chengkuizengella axinellae]|uniref:Uncharacterized protein n=1 Tax=Chengkuizengella axinellae TaxID=3064388 RepID=A0ABT9J4G2_9BACL|nr:hypothetical protein [Chengkuizengella sp. 2205SS18-9]MDP5276521.1 hypothetical protein [Chengkuizengella sp. 2205SS18-9]